ncbi:MAG: ABC transporter ATP-binding protein [Erysipelotrichaceae bacterium]|nr:ABC transporter ATP-binding protein [Erysipelotrichaceae bacterium]
MKLIFKYMKPFAITIVGIIILTFLQVQTELKLPDYMSDIVTNGIQYGGITESAPEIIGKSDMDELLLFTDEDDTILSSYELVSAGNTVRVKGKDLTLTEDSYQLKDESAVSDYLEIPLVYSYICQSQNIALSEETIDNVLPLIENAASSLSDNFGSMAKLKIGECYANVGLSTSDIQNNYILMIGGIMLVVAGISMLVQMASTYLATKTASKIANNLRRDTFSKIESFSSTEFSRFSTSSLITRTNNDIQKIQELSQMMMRMMLMAPIMGLTSVFKVIKYPSISWLLLVAIGVIMGAMLILAMFALPKFEVLQKLTDKMNSVLREFLDGMLVIRAFNGQKKEEDKFDDVNKELTSVNLFVSRMMNLMSPVMTITMNVLTIAITWFSAHQIDMDVISIGDMMAFSQYAMHVVMSFMMVTMMFVMIPRSLVSARRVKEVLDTENSIVDPENPVEIGEENGVLSFNHVDFTYPGAEEKVLSDVSFEARPGETVAIIGSTGSGKSTIIKLIPRLFDVSGGSITYNGHDIREYRQSELHDKIGFASQKGVLFTGTIRSNIEFGRDISDEELEEAIRISQSENIIAEKEEGVDSAITQGGTNVSGGQKQRISIARVLAQKKNIYIFDDTFSALDYATDKKLRSELNELIEKTRSTVIIVAQRISTIRNADKIIVLDEGKVVGEGRHEELLNNCDVYKEIAYSQLSKEELA